MTSLAPRLIFKVVVRRPGVGTRFASGDRHTRALNVKDFYACHWTQLRGNVCSLPWPKAGAMLERTKLRFSSGKKLAIRSPENGRIAFVILNIMIRHIVINAWAVRLTRR